MCSRPLGPSLPSAAQPRRLCPRRHRRRAMSQSDIHRNTVRLVVRPASGPRTWLIKGGRRFEGACPPRRFRKRSLRPFGAQRDRRVATQHCQGELPRPSSRPFSSRPRLSKLLHGTSPFVTVPSVRTRTGFKLRPPAGTASVPREGGSESAALECG